jgi:branched-chain amino acid transport system substrate-binding protein
MRPSPNARALAAASASVTLLACSAIVSHLDAQCATDADCAKFTGTACVAGGCVTPEAVADAGSGDDGAGPDTCATTSDCIRRHGEAWICRNADGTCHNLRSPDCPTVLGEYTSDDAVVVGALLPLFGEHGSTGAAMVDAIRLAVSDFAGAAVTAGASTPPRSVAVVVCNESNGALRPANHLTQDLLAPAILGTADSASTLDVVNGVTVPNGVLLMSPRATTEALTGAAASGLVWRTCGSTAVEAAALTALAERVMQDVATKNGLTTVHVALVHATDVASTELDAAIAGSLVVNGQPAGDPTTFLHVDYGDPDRITGAEPPAPRYDAAIAAVTSANPPPDVILLVGSTQAASHVLPGIEGKWAGARKPQYVVSSGLQTAELLAQTRGKDALRARIVGVAPGGDDANRTAFVQRFRQTFADDTAPESFGVSQTFDALYLLTLAASGASKPALVGRDLSGALSRALHAGDAGLPTTVALAPSGITSALDAFGAGRRIAVDGASGPLVFDATGGITTDVQVWCVAPGDSPRFENSQLVYDAGTKALTGTFACP